MATEESVKKIEKTKKVEKKPEEKKMDKSKKEVGKLKDLKIELLKNPTKRKSIKKEIARLLTMGTQIKLGGKE